MRNGGLNLGCVDWSRKSLDMFGTTGRRVAVRFLGWGPAVENQVSETCHRLKQTFACTDVSCAKQGAVAPMISVNFILCLSGRPSSQNGVVDMAWWPWALKQLPRPLRAMLRQSQSPSSKWWRRGFFSWVLTVNTPRGSGMDRSGRWCACLRRKAAGAGATDRSAVTVFRFGPYGPWVCLVPLVPPGTAANCILTALQQLHDTSAGECGEQS